MLLVVVVLALVAERVVRVGDVVLVAVLLDGARGVVPRPAVVVVARVGAEPCEVGGWIVVVAGDKLVDARCDFVLDGRQSGELVAVLDGERVVCGLLAAGDRERVMGVVELAVEVVDGLADEQSLGRAGASPSGTGRAQFQTHVLNTQAQPERTRHHQHDGGPQPQLAPTHPHWALCAGRHPDES
ncbi:MAG: hypothetical protein M3Q30_19195 [Actinomycetota bacterium]|nr:hypothetical protein [Actinomycetota bacterium]